MQVKTWILCTLLGLSACGTNDNSAVNQSDASTEGTDAGLSPDADKGNGELRVATINLRCLLEEWPQRLPLIVAELSELRPDVIALQEVCRDQNSDSLLALTTALNDATGENYTYARADTHIAWDVYQEGIALLSRHALQNVAVLDLPTGVFPRKAVIAQIDTGTATLQIATTHLSFGDQASTRVNQLGALRNAMGVRRVGGESLLIAGDMNEGPQSGAITDAISNSYKDSWAEVHPDNAGLTFPASAPDSRIDYLLLSPGSDQFRITSMERFLTSPTNDRYPSDHVALWADLSR